MPEGDYAVKVAATKDENETDLALARKQSHDQLIAELGHLRTGGVSWFLFPPTQREGALEDLGLVPKITDELRRWFKKNPEGVLVVAFAPFECDHELHGGSSCYCGWDHL